ncbi:MAG: Do family serine endopeptidase [Puniceicoccales bacterium]|jgi:serine protease Do/serine protease DegQ|nr:Do family serine endopeptidase [Puniceicoccales bacterium]
MIKPKTSIIAGGATAAALALALAFAPVFAAPPKKPAEPKKPTVEFKLDATPLDRSNKLKLSSYADVLDKVTPAVVSIRTTRTVQASNRRQGQSLEDLLREFHGGAPRRNVPAPGPGGEQRVPAGLGSGTIVHPDGYILTNRHVVSTPNGEPAEEITVELSDKRKFTAKVVGADPKTDIAVIKIEDKNVGKLPIAKIADSSALRVGDIVFAVGNPLGVGMSVSQGIVSALAREIGILRSEGGLESFIQTDASINPGNSGGPLVDTEGRVIGVNTAIASPTRSSIGLGFAVPSNLAVDVVTSLVNKGSVSRGYFGVEIMDVTAEIARALGLPSAKGAFVARVEEKSPAEKGGLKDGDTITAINGEAVESPSSLRLLISKLKPNQTAKVEVWRDNKKVTLSITAGSQQTGESLKAIFGQIELAELSRELRDQHNVPEFVKKGIVVVRNPDESGSTNLSRFLRPGAVIVKVNRKAVTTTAELTEAVKKGEWNLIQVYSRGAFRTFPAQL